MKFKKFRIKLKKNSKSIARNVLSWAFPMVPLANRLICPDVPFTVPIAYRNSHAKKNSSHTGDRDQYEEYLLEKFSYLNYHCLAFCVLGVDLEDRGRMLEWVCNFVCVTVEQPIQ